MTRGLPNGRIAVGWGFEFFDRGAMPGLIVARRGGNEVTNDSWWAESEPGADA